MCLSLVYVCVCLFVFGWVDPVHVEGLSAGFVFPTPRWVHLEAPFNGVTCAPPQLGAPKSTLYYGKNQIVVRLADFTANNFRQIKLYGYVNSNNVNKSTSISAGFYNGIEWSYDEISSRVLSTVYNGTTPPNNFPQGERFWNQQETIDIPQGITCTPHCTLQFLATTVAPSGALASAVSCTDVVLQERRSTSVYMTLRPDGCCPLEPVTVARRLYEISGGVSPFSATAFPLWDYQADISAIVSNVWYIDHTAPNTFTINPQTGYYSVKLVIHDQYNQTAQQFMQMITNTQLVSSALSPDSRGANNSYVWWGDAPNTYLPGGNPIAGANGKSSNAAASLSLSSSAQHISILTVATTLIAHIIANKAHI